MEPYKITINGVEYVDIQVVAEYYDVKVETIRDWIKKGRFLGKKSQIKLVTILFH